MFNDIYLDVPVPNRLAWIDSSQQQLASLGSARTLSVFDLLVCGTAAIKGLVLMHDDVDYEFAARNLSDVATRRVTDDK